jgi:hypothetical protein
VEKGEDMTVAKPKKIRISERKERRLCIYGTNRCRM